MRDNEPSERLFCPTYELYNRSRDNRRARSHASDAYLRVTTRPPDGSPYLGKWVFNHCSQHEIWSSLSLFSRTPHMVASLPELDMPVLGREPWQIMTIMMASRLQLSTIRISFNPAETWRGIRKAYEKLAQQVSANLHKNWPHTSFRWCFGKNCSEGHPIQGTRL